MSPAAAIVGPTTGRPADDRRPRGNRPARRGEDERDREDECGSEDDYSKRHGSPAANDFRIRRATTMRCTSSGPS